MNGSSKGNQNKFVRQDVWYKESLMGYEPASEYVVSKLLRMSNCPYYVDYGIVGAKNEFGTPSIYSTSNSFILGTRYSNG